MIASLDPEAVDTSALDDPAVWTRVSRDAAHRGMWVRVEPDDRTGRLIVVGGRNGRDAAWAIDDDTDAAGLIRMLQYVAGYADGEYGRVKRCTCGASHVCDGRAVGR